MAEVDRVVWKNCVNQQAQAIISRVATLTELESVDSFTENEEFIQWCHENYTHQAGISRIWAVTHIQESELFPSYFEQSLVSVSHYVRNSDVKTFTILDYGKSRGLNKVLYLSGCPQIGKSTTVFAWLLAQVAEDKTTRFLWIHCTEGIYYFIDSNGPEGQLRCSGSVLHANLEQVLMKARSNYQIICFDGNFGQSIKTLVSIAHRLGRFVIVCSPERMVKVKFAFEDLHPMITLLVDSWTLEDYQQMNQNNLFNYLNNGHRLSNEELRLQHYYGGGCLYQFKGGKALAVRNYRRRLEEFGTNQLSFLEAGTSSTESKSSLLAVYNGNSVIVSDFVREEISKAANHDVMKSLRAVYSSNPRFQAFRSQYEVEFILRMCVNANRGIRFWGFRYFTMYGGRQSATHSLKVLNYVNYDNLLDLSAITNGILKSGTIYLLNGSLHETFHFVFYEVASGIHQFYFVNVSDVATRDFNYQLCGAFISTFFPEFPLQQQRAFPTMGIIRPTNYHVHVSYLTSKENFERARVGREENIEDIRNYDNLFTGARIKYFEGSAF